MFLKNQKLDKKISQNNVKLDYLTKDSKKSPASTSGRWIAFFVKKLKKGYVYDTIFV